LREVVTALPLEGDGGLEGPNGFAQFDALKEGTISEVEFVQTLAIVGAVGLSQPEQKAIIQCFADAPPAVEGGDDELLQVKYARFVQFVKDLQTLPDELR
jgi:hypothetical protein